MNGKSHHEEGNPQGSPQPKNSSEEFREGGYGWVCVACTFFMNAHTWGINAVRQERPLCFLR